MRIAVFSDVHGNPYACEDVLKEIKINNTCEATVFAGDLCLGGSDPASCVDMLREAGVIAVYGNTDVYINSPEQNPKDENHLRKWGKLQPAVYWVRSKLSSKQLDWLGALPFSYKITPTQDPKDDLLTVHANPKNIELMIYPDENEQKHLWGKVRQPDNDPDLINALDDTKADTLAFGHFHYPSRRKWCNKLLVNVASCSLPGVNYDHRAHYTIFTWTNGRWSVNQHSIEYDVEHEINALYASDMPSKDLFISYFGV